MNKTLIILSTVWLLTGCQASLKGAADATPAILGQVETLKTDIVVAPIAGCVGMLQAVSGQIKALEAGTPGLAVASPSSSTAPTHAQSKSQPQTRAHTKAHTGAHTTEQQRYSYSTLQHEWEASGRPFTGSVITASN